MRWMIIAPILPIVTVFSVLLALNPPPAPYPIPVSPANPPFLIGAVEAIELAVLPEYAKIAPLPPNIPSTVYPPIPPTARFVTVGMPFGASAMGNVPPFAQLIYVPKAVLLDIVQLTL